MRDNGETSLMSDDIDLAQAAAQFIKYYGDKAPVEATRLAFEAQTDGDRDGYEVWMGVVIKIQELQRPKRKRGERLH
jgi:hypothetical protein